MLVILAGLPGTGKSALARAAAALTGGAVLDKDSIRAALFAPDDVEYSAGQDDFCLSVMLAAAGFLWRKDPRRPVFLDGRTFSREYQIRLAVRHAERLELPWRIIECVCLPETARRRIAEDVAAARHPAKNRTPELYDAIRRQFEPIQLAKLVVDTDRPLDICVRDVAGYIEGGSQQA